MSLPVFWLESLPDVDDDRVLLDGAEGHHAAVVRRIRSGERVRVTDGRGTYVEGPVVTAGRQGLGVAVESRVSVPAPALRLSVVQAVPKGERAEIAVQALVEVGVDRVVPWAAGRSQVRVSGERGERMLVRWRAWAVEASKQAGRSWFCEVADVATTAEVAALLGAADVALVLDAGAVEPLGAAVLPPEGEVVLVVGPEGGIGADELAALGVPPASPPGRPPAFPPGRPPTFPPGRPPTSGGDTSTTRRGDHRFPPLVGGSEPAAPGPRAVRLGDTVLRTSTAGPVAAGIVLARTRWRGRSDPPSCQPNDITSDR